MEPEGSSGHWEGTYDEFVELRVATAEFDGSTLGYVRREHYQEVGCEPATWLEVVGANGTNGEPYINFRVRTETLQVGQVWTDVGADPSTRELVVFASARFGGEVDGRHLKGTTVTVSRWDTGGFELRVDGGSECPSNNPDGPDCVPFTDTLTIASVDPVDEDAWPPRLTCFDKAWTTSDGYCHEADLEDPPIVACPAGL